MTSLKIVLKDYPQTTEIYDAETGKPFLGVMAFVLSATPHGMEARIFTDEAMISEKAAGECGVSGECTVPVVEQVVITHIMLKTLAKLVSSELTTELVSTMSYHEERDARLRVWYDELERTNETFISAVAAEVEQRLARNIRMTAGVRP